MLTFLKTGPRLTFLIWLLTDILTGYLCHFYSKAKFIVFINYARLSVSVGFEGLLLNMQIHVTDN